MNEAIQKINAEIEKEKSNPYVKMIGQFLIGYIEQNPESAEKFADKDKTVLKSLDAMRKAAEKKKSGNYAILTDQEGFEIVLEYFGVDAKLGVKPKLDALAPAPTVPQIQSVPKTESNFSISLDDLL